MVCQNMQVSSSPVKNIADWHLGTFLYNHLIPYSRSLRSELPECISDEEADLFLGFMRRMLCWMPEERATAAELRTDPWLEQII